MKYIIIILFLLFANTTLARNFYFSTLFGNDSRTEAQAQSSSTPWQTISQINTFFGGSTPHTFLAGDSILLARGETFYTTTGIIVTKSGGSSNQIVFGAYGTGAKPVITGMNNLTFTISARSHIWTSTVAASSLDSINIVTKNNSPIEMGRWPNISAGNGGYNEYHSASGNTITTKSGELTSIGAPTNYVGATLVYRAQRFWTIRAQIWNKNANTLKFTPQNSGASPQTQADKWGYFVQDESTTLDEDGEWWFNRITKKLDLYWTSGTAPSGVQAPSCINLVIVNSSISYVTFTNINFNGCDGDIVDLDGAHITFDNCIFQNAGRNAISNAASYATITNDTINNTMACGLVILTGGDHTYFRYNYVHNVEPFEGHGSGERQDGVIITSGSGIYIVAGNTPGPSYRNADISYNSFIKMGFSAVNFSRYDTVHVNYNYIDTVAFIQDDVGAIYQYINSASSWKDKQIIGNTIKHGIGVPYASDNTSALAGIAGIYLDQGCDNTRIEDNYVDSFYQGVFLNVRCTDILVKNNVLYNNTRQLQINTRTGDTTRRITINNNKLFCKLSSQVALYANSSNSWTLINLFGDASHIIDSNFFLRPILSGTTNDSLIRAQRHTSTKDSLVTLAGWQNYSPFDDHSHTAPFTYASSSVQDTSVLLLYNYTNMANTKHVLATYIDDYAAFYNRNITLGAYGGGIFYKTSPFTADIINPTPRDKWSRGFVFK